MHRWLAPLALLGIVVACSEDVTAPPGGEGGADGSTSASSGGASSNVLEDAQLGDPMLFSAQRLAFGPGGVLLIGDGRSDRIVAIETGDTSSAPREANAFERVDNLSGAAADAIGGSVTAADLLVNDIAVNPVSGRTYVAVTRHDELEAHVLWIDPDGDVRLFDTSNVVYASVDVPPAEGSAATIAEVVWTDDHVIGTVTPQTLVRHELTFVETPFEHEGRVRQSTTRVFHRSFNQWITELPMDRFFYSEGGGERYVIGSFTSTVARYVVDEIDDGQSDVQGETVFDLLDGRTVLDFLPYERDGELVVLTTVSNLLFDGKPGALRIDGEIFHQTEAINDESPILIDFAGSPLVAGVERVPQLDDAQRLALRGDDVVMLAGNALVAEPLEEDSRF
jgi:hypothetical protein